MLAEMMEKTRIDKVVGHMKEQMTILQYFIAIQHYEESMTEVKNYQHYLPYLKDELLSQSSNILAKLRINFSR